MGQSSPLADREDPKFQLALAAFRAGNFEKAEILFRAVLSKNSEHVGALNLLGVVLANVERFAEAEPVLRQALQAQTSESTLYNYGLVLKALKRVPQRHSSALRVP